MNTRFFASLVLALCLALCPAVSVLAVIVQNNMTATNTNRMLENTAKTLQKSMEKLASGYRVSRAADDAAGLPIAEKMRSQLRGLDQAARNANDGISLSQTAEGALNEIHSMLQRMGELVTRLANDTSTDNDRLSITQEIDKLAKEAEIVREKGMQISQEIELFIEKTGQQGQQQNNQQAQTVQQQIAQALADMSQADLLQVAGLLAPQMSQDDLLQVLMNLGGQVTDSFVKGLLANAVKDLQSRTLSPQELADMTQLLLGLLKQVPKQDLLAVLQTLLPQLGDDELRAVLTALLAELQKNNQLPGLQQNVQGWLAQLPAQGKPFDRQTLAELLAGNPPIDPKTLLDSPKLYFGKSLGESLLHAGALNGNASVSGSLLSDTFNDAGIYSFNVNLASGRISGGAMSGSVDNNNYTYNLFGGIGKVSGNTFQVNGFQGTIMNGGAPFPASGSLNGATNRFDVSGSNGLIQGSGRIVSRSR